jgi:hypothetical protein
MKLHVVGTVNRLNVEHRTSNIERPILIALRFIDFKTSEPQPATSPSVVSSGLEPVESSRVEFRRVASLVQRFQPVGFYPVSLQAGGAGACAAPACAPRVAQSFFK